MWFHLGVAFVCSGLSVKGFSHFFKLGKLMTTFTSVALAVSAACVSQEATPTPESRKSELGQFMTPSPIADFMAKQFCTDRFQKVLLLDAGAGQGALSIAFAKRWEPACRPSSSSATGSTAKKPARVRAWRWR